MTQPQPPNTSPRSKRRARTAISIEMGQRLRKLRERHNMTQQDVAKHLAISYQQLQKYETGDNRIPIESLTILCTLFHVPYDYFLKTAAGSNDPKAQEDIRLSSYLLNRIQKVKAPRHREKILKVVDILCS